MSLEPLCEPMSLVRQGELESLYESMSLIRQAEEALLDLFAQGKLYGTTHTSIGQEAIAVAVGSLVQEDDFVFAPHRCHGHFLAYGGPLELLFCEVMGRQAGVCGGLGGSQHLHYKHFFSNGIQGGIVGNAVGAALAQRLKEKNGIVVVFLGDGTLGEGLVYESLNFASLQDLPILFVLEDNRYAQSTPSYLGVSGSMPARALAFDIQADEIETNDILELQELFTERFKFVREKKRPFFQVVHTYRLAAHSKGDDNRDPKEIEAWREKEPLRLLRNKLTGQTVKHLDERIGKKVRGAIAGAEASPASTCGAIEITLEEHIGREETDPPFPCLPIRFVESLNAALKDLLEEHGELFLLGEDILDPYGGAFKVTRGLSSMFPERVITSPISEAGLVAWGVGAALLGLRPIVEIMFGDFLALAADQILNHAAKYRWMYNRQVEVPLVIRTPMGGRRGYGPTHSQSIETMFLNVPGLTIVAPSLLFDPGQLLKRCVLLSKMPVLFIENKSLYPNRLLVHDKDRINAFFMRSTRSRYPTAHLSLTQFEKPDIVLLAYGANATLAMEVAERLLTNREIIADVIVPTLISPVPVGEIIQLIDGCPAVCTIEEGQKSGGWGAEISAVLCEHSPSIHRRFMRFAAASCPIPSAKPLEEGVLPSVESIVQLIERELL